MGNYNYEEILQPSPRHRLEKGIKVKYSFEKEEQARICKCNEQVKELPEMNC